MNNKDVKLESSAAKPSSSAAGVILTVVCILSGLYSCARMAQMFPIWLAVLVAAAVGILLVASLTASLGNELLDIAIGCVVIVIWMTVVVPVFAKKFQQFRQTPVKVNQTIRKAL